MTTDIRNDFQWFDDLYDRAVKRLCNINTVMAVKIVGTIYDSRSSVMDWEYIYRLENLDFLKH